MLGLLFLHVLFWVSIGAGLKDGELDSRDAAIMIMVWLALVAGLIFVREHWIWFLVALAGFVVITAGKVFGYAFLTKRVK